MMEGTEGQHGRHMKAIQINKSPVHVKAFEKPDMRFRSYSVSHHRNTERNNDKGMQIKIGADFTFELHAITIHDSVVPLEVFKATVTAKKSEIHRGLKGSSAPELNQQLHKPKSNIIKNYGKTLWY